MKRYRILHQTRYEFSDFVQLLAHTLRLRPREGHELRIESSTLDISPTATLRWTRDVEGNSVATATFTDRTNTLNVLSNIVIQQYNQAPYDFLVAEYAVNYPFIYCDDDRAVLTPYMRSNSYIEHGYLDEWLGELWQPDEQLQTFALLLRLNQRIFQFLSYQRREEEGVQPAEQTLNSGSGSCRDAASLFMTAARQLGFASRFVSGYLHAAATNDPAGPSGSTHAWAEVFIPGAGWKGFDPTTGDIVGADHIAVAVARMPALVPPIAGSFVGVPGANMAVNVWVTELA